jgi:uncharacterized protein (TIGR00369 family)
MVRIEGHDKEALSQREGGIWDVLSGKVPPRTAIGRMLGAKLRYVDPDEGIIAWEYPANPELANPFGQITGGILAHMLDVAMGMALSSTLQPDEFPQTIELKVNYLRAAKLAPVVCEGRIVRKGRSIAFLAGDVRDAEGEILTTATATFAIQQRR